MPIRTLQYLPLEFSVQLFKRNISSFTRLISVLLDLSVNSQELYAPNCFKLIIFTSSRNVLLRFIWNAENGISLHYYKGVRQEGRGWGGVKWAHLRPLSTWNKDSWSFFIFRIKWMYLYFSVSFVAADGLLENALSILVVTLPRIGEPK